MAGVGWMLLFLLHFLYTLHLVLMVEKWSLIFLCLPAHLPFAILPLFHDGLSICGPIVPSRLFILYNCHGDGALSQQQKSNNALGIKPSASRLWLLYHQALFPVLPLLFIQKTKVSLSTSLALNSLHSLWFSWFTLLNSWDYSLSHQDFSLLMSRFPLAT